MMRTRRRAPRLVMPETPKRSDDSACSKTYSGSRERARALVALPHLSGSRARCADARVCDDAHVDEDVEDPPRRASEECPDVRELAPLTGGEARLLVRHLRLG